MSNNPNELFQNRPVTMCEKNNLLQIEEHVYILDDVDKPNVFRNMFPYSEVPKIPFNDRIVPHNMPKDIWITDTTFRDGQQSFKPYTVKQIVDLYKLMNKLGLKGKQRKNDKYHSYKGTVGKIADNLLKRDFKADKPFEKITTDVTQFKIGDEKVYLSPVLDLFKLYFLLIHYYFIHRNIFWLSVDYLSVLP